MEHLLYARYHAKSFMEQQSGLEKCLQWGLPKVTQLESGRARTQLYLIPKLSWHLPVNIRVSFPSNFFFFFKHATGQKYSHVNMHCFSSSPGLVLRNLCKEGRGRRIDLSRRLERPGEISFQPHSGRAATERREGSWQSLGGQEFGKKEKKGRAWGAAVAVWNFEEERFGRILKRGLAMCCAA